MSTLKEHLNAKIGNSKQINESLVLSAIVCATCIGYAAGPILNTDFMKSVGSGIGSLLSGIGSLFGFGKKKEEEKKKEEDKKKEDKKNEEEDKIATLKAILKKDPDDMTGKEKEMLEKAANNPRLQKEFSNNELKKLNKAIGVSGSDDDDESMPEGDEKKMHDILKKKPEDMTPKDKKMLKSFNDKYDLSDYLSKGELDKMSAAGISVGTKQDDDDDDDFDRDEFVKSGNFNACLLKIAAKANEEEKDPDKKKKMDAMLDVAIASTYDENGNVLPLEEQRKKMKETVGDENWEAFSKDLDTYVDEAREADYEKFKKDIKSAYGNLSVEELEKIDENQKKRAKEASERIAKEKDEQKKLDDEIADLQKQIEEKSKDSVMKDDANPEIKELNKKIKEAQDKKAELVNNSTLGTATPSVAKNINDRDKENNGVDVTADPKKDDKKDGEGEKDNTGNGDKPKEPKKDDKTESEPKKDDKTESEPKKDDKTESEPKKEGDDDTKKKLDDAEAKWKEREADFEKKWEKKLDDAETDADKEKVMDEYDKAKKRLKAAKNKDLDSIDDNDDHDTEKDATKKGKYKVKEEEVTDPKTGEKIKVTTYTGPRGGKFYYPDGKPKKPENKVYVHENVTYRITPFNRLRRYLLEQLNLK